MRPNTGSWLRGDDMKVLFLTTHVAGERKPSTDAASQTIIDDMSRLGADVTRLSQERDGTNRRSSTFGRQIRDFLRSAQFDVVIIHHAALGWVTEILPNHVRVVALVHGIEHEVHQRSSHSSRPWSQWLCRKQARLLQRLESQLAQRADEIWTFTPHDAAFFARLSGGRRTRVMTPSGLANPSIATISKTHDVALLSDWTSPSNIDGLQWFLTQVYPKLPPDITIRIGGKGADCLVGRYRNVAYQSFVGNTHKFLAEARVAAILTISDVGMHADTLTALSAGSRIVATPCALRGLSALPSDVVAAGDPDTFAKQLAAAIRAPDDGGVRIEAMRWTSERKHRHSMELAAGLRIAPPAPSTQPAELTATA